MPDVFADCTTPVFFSNQDQVYCETQITFYGTLDDANKYFDNRLPSTAWDNASLTNRRKALITATQAIDLLNFSGDKAVAGQGLQFPRGTNEHIPADIKIATYEEAYVRLDGIETQREIDNLRITSHGFSVVKTTYDTQIVPENVIAGIFSHKAWRHLVAYLRDPGELVVSRNG